MTRYLKAYWHHADPNDPVLMPFPDEIDSQDEFTTAPIDARELEREWRAARAERPEDADCSEE